MVSVNSGIKRLIGLFIVPLFLSLFLPAGAAEGFAGGMHTAKTGLPNQHSSKNRTLPAKCEIFEIGSGWQFRRAGRKGWSRAAVPGCVHTDLYAIRRIADPFHRDNEADLQWIEDENWEYRKSFTAGRKLLGREKIEIHFEGLDTYARVYVNDSLVISANNMFREWEADIGGIIREGENEIRIYFRSPLREARQRSDELGYELPGGDKVFTRKAGYQYGWDFGPRFVTSGIWRPVYVKAWDGAEIESLHLFQNRVTDERAELSAVFEIEAAAVLSGLVSVSLPGEGEGLASAEVTLSPGKNLIELDFEIPNPDLWWTNGLGRANLYDLCGRLAVEGSVVDEVSERIGIRTIELVSDRDGAGESFHFRLNGVPLFMKGSNYIPQDDFPSSVSPERYEALLRSVVDADMNMLRVWGGGIYEDDVFYDLCDESGILIWQDFMFACAMYPGDKDFLANVEQEAIQNVKRLRNHPCIALWCGNNEIDEGWHNWGWQESCGYSAEDSARIWKGYEALFHKLLPAVVDRYDRGRSYWPSSPKYGRGDSRSLYAGDSHYWGVWHDGEPFEIFESRVGRFMSEYGFQSFPGFEAVKRFSSPGDWEVDSRVMLSHQKHPRGNRIIMTYLERDYRVPKDFESFLYVSQLLQAEGIKIAVEAHRRGMPYCMGTLYWQLNDCWPAVSWSGIDYYGRWKALHYYVKRAYGEVLISPSVDDQTVRVHIVSDRLSPIRGRLDLRLVDFSGAVLWTRGMDTVIEANSSRQYFEVGAAELLDGKSLDRLVLDARVWEGGELLSRNLHYFLPPGELSLPVPVINKRVVSREKGYTIELSSEMLVKNLFLSIEGSDGFFSDNYFDLLPGETARVDYIVDERIDGIEERLEIKSLVDAF